MVRSEAGPDVHIFLVGGKSDLKHKRALTIEVPNNQTFGAVSLSFIDSITITLIGIYRQ